jgi:hypothetical protein
VPRRFFDPLAKLRLGAFLLALVACEGSAPSEHAAPSREPILNGEPSPPGSREDGVLALRTVLDGSELICSAVLVAPNLALTARHCVSHLVRGRFTCTVRGELLSEDPGAGSLGAHFTPADIEFYGGEPPREEPLARGDFVLSTLSESICLNDLAFVGLDRSLTLPALPLRLEGRAARGEAVTLVGYGLDETMDEGDPLDLRTQPRLRNDVLAIAEIGPQSSDDVVTITPPRTIVVEGPSGCFGDSGGPLLSHETGAVLGIYSLLAGGGCKAPEGRHLFAHVPDFPALTRDAFERAGQEPRPEASAGGGEGGAAGAENAPSAGEGGAAEEPPRSAGGAGETSDHAGEGGRQTPSAGGESATGGEAVAASAGSGGNGAAAAPLRKKSSGGCALAGPPAPAAAAWLAALIAACAGMLATRRARRAFSGAPRADLPRSAAARR